MYIEWLLPVGCTSNRFILWIKFLRLSVACKNLTKHFILAFLICLSCGNDKLKALQVEFVEELIKQAGVVAVPGRVFFHTNSSKLEDFSSTAITYHMRYIRSAFCKSEETLAGASQKLTELVDGSGRLELF